MDKREHLQQIVLGKLDFYMQWNVPITLTHTHTNQLKILQRAKSETLKVLEKNICSVLHDGCEKRLPEQDSICLRVKLCNCQEGLHKIKNLETIIWVRRKPTD